MRCPFRGLPLALDPCGLALRCHLGLMTLALDALALLLGGEFGLALDPLLLAGVFGDQPGQAGLLRDHLGHEVGGDPVDAFAQVDDRGLDLLSARLDRGADAGERSEPGLRDVAAIGIGDRHDSAGGVDDRGLLLLSFGRNLDLVAISEDGECGGAHGWF